MKNPAANTNKDPVDSAQGAIIGALIGDALGLGCHWHYDINELRKDFGPWISDYTTSKTDRKDRFADIAEFRYNSGCRAGDVSQTGQVYILLLESLASQGKYNENDFTARLDAFLSTIDGTPFSGRYTDMAMRDIWKHRNSGIDWSDAGSMGDTAEAAIRSTILAARYFQDPEKLAGAADQNITLSHKEPYIVGQSISFALTVAALIGSTPLEKLRQQMAGLAEYKSIMRLIPSFDLLIQVTNGAIAVGSNASIEPASLICQLNGLNCSLGVMLPSAYYFIHRYPDNFEMAVLSAVNGGGNNMARAALTGSLSGAMVGLSGIPKRFISGLNDHERLLDLAKKVATSRRD